MGQKARRKPNGQLHRTPAVTRAPASIPSHLEQEQYLAQIRAL